MSARDRSVSAFDALTEKELEILRLLTTGHTIKSISARLGRSEASINERLRDARRKTGVGSSRELARRVAAQKIWDRKIDLSDPASTGDQQETPTAGGRPWSKGTIVMLITLALAASGLMFAQASTTRQAAPVAQNSAQASAPASPPIAGRWLLDLDKLPPEERPRSVTLEFRVSGNDVWTGRSDIVAADGSTQHAETVVASDGAPVPLIGNQLFADMVSLRQPAPNTLVLTFTRNGAQVSTRVYTVEGDGKSMKETIVWAHDTSPRTVTTYFHRIG